MIGVGDWPEDWQGAIAAWLVALVAANRPATTVGLRRYQLTRLANWSPVGPWQVTGELLQAWVGSQGWQPATLRSFRSAVRSFYGWAFGLGRIEVDPSRALPAVRPVEPNPRPTPEDAYRLALARADSRVRLMLRLAAELGLRRGEVATCHSDWLERDLMGWTLRVIGKGGRVRRLPLTGAQAAAVRACGPGYLFPGAVDGHLSAAWVGRLVSRLLPGAWAMHSLRHRFGTAAWSIDHDLLTVQELMGHASPVTTRMYILVPSERLRATVAAVARL